jgi:transcription antitermination factor NusG
MSPETDDPRWFALQVRSRWESSTTMLLSAKGYETLLPLYRRKKRGRLSGVSAPLFPGYVFCRFDAHKRLPVLVTPGVITVVRRGRVPLPVDNGEIAAIQAIVSSGLHAEPCPYLELGQRVRIEGDALEGLEGILTDFRGNHRVVLSVTLLRRSIALEIDRSCVRPISPARTPVLGPIGVPLLRGVVG